MPRAWLRAACLAVRGSVLHVSRMITSRIKPAALAGLFASLLACNAILGIDEARLSCSGAGDCPEAVAPQQPASSVSGAPASGAQASAAVDSSSGAQAARASSDAGAPDAGLHAVTKPASPEVATGNNLPVANTTPGEGSESAGSPGTPPGETAPDASAGGAPPSPSPAPPSQPPTPSAPPASNPTPPACPLCDSCSPAGFACQGTQLFSCDPVQRQSALVSDCGNAARCDAARGACVPPPVCTPNTVSCDGARLVTCNADGSAVTNTATCASAALCDAQAGTCRQTACAPNEHRCQDSQLLVCNADQTAFDLLADCGNSALCDAADGRCNLCVPGARRCADITTVAVCATSGLTEDNTGCGLLETCSGGTCTLLGGVPLP
jgi:hypothetical protein